MIIQPVKTAIVGCGMISDAYLNTMTHKFKILDVAGCCDRNPEKAQAKAQKYGIKVLTMEEILADDSIEIVVNLTAPTAHYPSNQTTSRSRQACLLREGPVSGVGTRG